MTEPMKTPGATWRSTDRTDHGSRLGSPQVGCLTGFGRSRAWGPAGPSAVPAVVGTVTCVGGTRALPRGPRFAPIRDGGVSCPRQIRPPPGKSPLPESLAYATIDGVPPVVGLYAAIPALVLYALVGSSHHLVVAPMSATAALSLGVVSMVTGDPGEFVVLTAGLALATGLAALLAGVLRLGFLAAFIREPVLKGFIIGLAPTIMIGQLPSLIRVEQGSGNFFEKLWDLVQNLGDAEALATVVGLSSLGVLLGLRPSAPRLPASLVVAALGIAAVAVFGLDDDGLDIVGTIDSGLPSLGLPDESRSDCVELLGAAIGVMLVGFAEGRGAAKT